MNLNWSLKEIYDSFECNEFKTDLETLDIIIKDINMWVDFLLMDKEHEVENLENYIKKFTMFNDLRDKLSMYVNLKLSVNTQDKLGLKYSNVIENKLTGIVESSTKIERYISSIDDIDQCINKSIYLKKHEYILKEIVKNSRHLLSEKEENIIASMKNTGSNAWIKLKDNLISTLMVEVEADGTSRNLPLTVILNMAYDKDEKVRKAAYEAEIASYKKVEEGVAAALNAIKGEVITVCNFRGFESPLAQSLSNSRMSVKTLNVMFEAMKESFPMFRKYLKRKAEMLGHKNGLPFYDLYAPVAECNMKYTYEEAVDFVEKNFRIFSDRLADYVLKAVNNSWIDVMPKEGKVGGAFCENLHFLGESRFLLNFGGSFSDVVTLAHELGHGFHGECLKNESTLNSYYPMPIAETASTFCETIIKKAALANADKKEALAILEAEISDCTQVIVDIYSRFIFESNLFEKRKESSLSVEEIKELMIEAQKETYGDGLDVQYLHPYMWTWKPHYYDPEYNYYNFPYAFGLLFARGLYMIYEKQKGDFVEEYEKLLSVTGKNDLEDITKTMGIDITKKDFWKNSLKTIEDDIDLFLKLCRK
ncbi:M3 family oligoendopeptidase [uncultured Clostridium sp.]|uniref:M3 family oligoendopeptidase n=1 Tax=uncultured Clostridium sp. TaxID=59620 RepID=UPI0025CCEBFC|nr:M3 family oligoendopeptidase [uncultured Clostridium sp.]